MSRRDRRDGDRRPGDRREREFEDEQPRRPNDQPDPLESDSLTALKAILAKVAALLEPLKLTTDESIRLVEQLYGSVLEMDVMLAGETDDRRKRSVQAQIQNAVVTRSPDNRIAVEFPVAAPEAEPEAAETPVRDGSEPAPVSAPTERHEAPATAASPAQAPASEAATSQDPASEAPAPAPAKAPRPRPAARPRPAVREATVEAPPEAASAAESPSE